RRCRVPKRGDESSCPSCVPWDVVTYVGSDAGIPRIRTQRWPFAHRETIGFAQKCGHSRRPERMYSNVCATSVLNVSAESLKEEKDGVLNHEEAASDGAE